MTPPALGNLYCEALRVSRNHIKQELKQKGIHLGSFKASEITQLAKGYLAANREELISRAMTDLVWARRCAQLKEFVNCLWRPSYRFADCSRRILMLPDND
jgi:hypothetical protein